MKKENNIKTLEHSSSIKKFHGYPQIIEDKVNSKLGLFSLALARANNFILRCVAVFSKKQCLVRVFRQALVICLTDEPSEAS